MYFLSDTPKGVSFTIKPRYLFDFEGNENRRSFNLYSTPHFYNYTIEELCKTNKVLNKIISKFPSLYSKLFPLPKNEKNIFYWDLVIEANTPSGYISYKKYLNSNKDYELYNWLLIHRDKNRQITSLKLTPKLCYSFFGFPQSHICNRITGKLQGRALYLGQFNEIEPMLLKLGEDRFLALFNPYHKQKIK